MLRDVLGIATRTAPVAVALGGALVVAGSLRADELTAAQGGVPWAWFALRSPAHLVLALVCATWALFRTGSERGPLRAFERFFATLVCALVVVVFFGGWRVPLSASHARGALAWACAGVLVSKTLLLSVAALAVRDALPPVGLGAIARATLLRLLPIAAAAVLGAMLWEHHMTARGPATVTTFALMGVGSAAVVLVAWPRARTRPRVDPLA